jgi:hypothetical protein
MNVAEKVAVLFGAQVEVGRTFSKQEDVPGGPRLVAEYLAKGSVQGA